MAAPVGMRLAWAGVAGAAGALLLASCGGAGPSATSGPEAGLPPNAACYVCHMNLMKDPLTATHAKAGITCMRCHGLSAAHANDEDIGATKPDVTFRRTGVNVFCRTCHPTHDAAPEKLVARWQDRTADKPATRPAIPAATCTECHGRHKTAKPRSPA